MVDREPWVGKTKDYKIGICCFSTTQVALNMYMKKEQTLVVSESGECIRMERHVYHWTVVLVSQHNKNQIKLLISYKVDINIINLTGGA
jgi:hypothetical protein